MSVLADTLSAMIGATAEEEEEVEDDGKTVALAKGGVTGLARTTGRTNLVRTILRAMLASLHCHHHQEGTTTPIRTRGLGASRSRAQLLAS